MITKEELEKIKKERSFKAVPFNYDDESSCGRRQLFRDGFDSAIDVLSSSEKEYGKDASYGTTKTRWG